MEERAWTSIADAEIGEIFRIDDPENRCFGCSPHNPRGLAIEFVRVAEHVVEVPYRAEADVCGAPGIVHGGVQATLLDEAMGVAAQTAFPGERPQIVTVDFSLRYRRPVPVDVPVVIRAELVERVGRDVSLKGAILDEQGERLTVAEARWRRID